MDAKFYIKNLTNPSKQNSGEGNETDPIKRYLNQLAAKAIENEASYFDILDFEHPSPTVLEKNFYTTLLQQSQVNINSENKIGDENNYEFVIMEYPDNIEDYTGNQKELFEASKFVFINEENVVYFLNKFIKASTKEYMKLLLYSMDFESTDLDALGINVKNFEEKIAINNLKFAIDLGVLESNLIVIDDIDLQAFYTLKGINEHKVRCVFDENEDKIMFKVTADIFSADYQLYVILFKFSNNAAILTENINGTDYKIVGDNINA